MSAARQEEFSIFKKILFLCNFWHERISDPAFNPGSVLNKLSDMLETEMKIYCEIYPHPFDHNKKSILKQLTSLNIMINMLVHSKFKSWLQLMQKLINDYLKNDFWPTRTEDNHNLNIAACRLLINFSFGINFKSIFSKRENDQIIQKLFPLANNPCVLLHTYAIGLLANFIKISKNSVYIREQNLVLIPKILNRLHDNVMFCEDNIINQNSKIFSQLNNDTTKIDKNTAVHKSSNNENPNMSYEDCCQNIENDLENSSNEPILEDVCGICEDSSSSLAITKAKSSDWIEIYPLTSTTKSYFDLKYLYQITRLKDNFDLTYEENFLNLILKIINSLDQVNVYLIFEAMKYFDIFLCQQNKIAIELVTSQLLQKLLLIPKHSINSTGVLMWFYHMSLFKEGMEKICLLSERTLVDLVEYELCMLEHSDYSKINAQNKRRVFLFFGYSFHFSVIQKIFDDCNGLLKIVNMVWSLPILTSNLETADFSSSRKLIHYFLHCLKQYFIAHLDTKTEDSSIMIHNESSIPNFKLNKSSQAEVLKKIELLSNIMSINSHWTPVDELVKFKGLSLLMTIVDIFLKFPRISDRYEVIKNALEVINICAVLPKVQLLLCEPLSQIQTSDSPVENDNVGMNILMKIVERIKLFGRNFSAHKKASLSVIITCVCAPIHRGNGSLTCYSANESSQKQTHSTVDDLVIEKIWDCIRNNNGIMILLKSITTDEHPDKDADEIRGLACRALAGLARNETVCQIISKWPLFNNDQLKNLIKNPVRLDKYQKHVTFKKNALELLELVSGKTKMIIAEKETSLVNQANIITKTKINYDDQQLFHIIYQHLMTHDLLKTAEILRQEANFNTLLSTIPNKSIRGEIIPVNSKHSVENQKSNMKSSSNGFLSSGSNVQGMNPLPIHSNYLLRQFNMHPTLKPEPESTLFNLEGQKKLDQVASLQSDVINSSTVSLKSIVDQYLTNQHALCKHPVVTCPTFNLLVPHKCPDPKPRSVLSTNFAMRFSKNIHSRRQDQRLIFSRFCPSLKFDCPGETHYLCCDFLKLNRIAVGTNAGDIIVINTFTRKQELLLRTHHDYIKNLECSNDEKLLVTSSGISSAIWTISDPQIARKYSLDEHYCKLSNTYQTKLLGTRNEVATIYDVETSNKIMTLVPRLSNKYKRNQAVFDATNALVLSDGVLWDANAGIKIHKFEKLNMNLNGVFHPNGLEIISNSEVWDVRTFGLLRSVSDLDQCNVIFSKTGKGMYSYAFDYYDHNDNFLTSFKSFDPFDYSTLAMVHTKFQVCHMACDKFDSKIAVIQDSNTSSYVELYDVGCLKNNFEGKK